MRGTVAKKLRGLARGTTIGVQPLSYTLSERGDAIVNHQKSTRGVYRSLKRVFRRARRPS